MLAFSGTAHVKIYCLCMKKWLYCVGKNVKWVHPKCSCVNTRGKIAFTNAISS